MTVSVGSVTDDRTDLRKADAPQEGLEKKAMTITDLADQIRPTLSEHVIEPPAPTPAAAEPHPPTPADEP